MAYYDFDTTFSGLKGKTVVVTGKLLQPQPFHV